jgi:integrase
MTKTGEHSAWVADYFAPGPNGERQRHSKTFKTRREATAWLANTVVEIKQGVHTPAHKSPTVLAAGEQWIQQAVNDGLERSTVAQYRQHLRFHIRPFIGPRWSAGPSRPSDRSSRRRWPGARSAAMLCTRRRAPTALFSAPRSQQVASFFTLSKRKGLPHL